MSTHDIGPLTALQASLAGAQPSVVAAALARRSASVPDPSVPQPQPGQCWLLRWDQTILLAVITRVNDDHLLVMPVDVEASRADETALVLPAEDAGFGGDVAVFAMLETGIGPWVLDCFVATLTEPSPADALRHWMRTGAASDLPDGWREGTPTPHDAHPRRSARKDLAELISLLGEADWLADTWSRYGVPQVAASVVSPHDVLDVLGGTPQRALAIARGEVKPTAQDAERLAEAGIQIGTGHQPRRDVILELDSPSEKAALTTLATRQRTSEADLRQRLAQSLYGLAARRSADEDRDVSNEVLMLREAIRRELEQ